MNASAITGDSTQPILASVSDQWEFSVDPSQSLDVIELDGGAYQVLSNGQSYLIEILERDDVNKHFVLKINGTRYPVQLADGMDQLIKKMGFANQAAQKAKNIMAPMPGLVLEVNVEAGQTVSEGEALLILEAMKMENVLKAPADGIVKAIPAAQGSSVDKGQLLIEME